VHPVWDNSRTSQHLELETQRRASEQERMLTNHKAPTLRPELRQGLEQIAQDAQEIRLGGNEIDDQEARAISTAMATNASVQVLEYVSKRKV